MCAADRRGRLRVLMAVPKTDLESHSPTKVTRDRRFTDLSPGAAAVIIDGHFLRDDDIDGGPALLRTGALSGQLGSWLVPVSRG